MPSGKEAQIALIVGLGNPGRSYADTRHNLGARVVRVFAKQQGIVLKERKQFLGELGRGRDVQLLLPTTYMNESGRAVEKLASYYKLEPEEVLVVCDDIALPFGRIRIRTEGSAGGHRGLESVEHHLGTRNYPRMRLGIGQGDIELSEFVLARFESDEEAKLEAFVEQAVSTLERLLQGPVMGETI